MNILVTGSNGQLGRSIQSRIPKNTSNRYIFTDVAELDITRKDDITDFVNKNKIDLVVNCAAYTAVDAAEDNHEAASAINRTAVEFLADAIKKRNGFLIHISTDYVYGGEHFNTPISEYEKPAPTSVYGKTKLEGELEINKSGVNAIILRTAWLYSEFGKNFVKTVLSLLETRPEIKVVFDQTGTPTYAGNLARFIIDIIESGKLNGFEGTYHFTDEGVCSWFDFAVATARIKNKDKCMICPCLSAEFPTKAVRPPYSVLDKSLLKKTFNISLPYWRDSLEFCLNNNEA